MYDLKNLDEMGDAVENECFLISLSTTMGDLLFGTTLIILQKRTSNRHFAFSDHHDSG